MTKYNTTDLQPFAAISKNIVHRDQLAHIFRWSHILRNFKFKQSILDIGCGTGNLYEALYRNKFRPSYVGIDIRKKTIETAREKFPKAKFYCKDVVSLPSAKKHFDVITCLEVIEHIGKENGQKLLDGIKLNSNKNTKIFLSTPCYDEKVGAAKNHIIDGKVGEYKFEELKELLEDNFEIVEVNGTFASIKDYRHHMNEHEKYMYDKISSYYESSITSIMFAPLFPQYSRNCIWQLKLK